MEQIERREEWERLDQSESVVAVQVRGDAGLTMVVVIEMESGRSQTGLRKQNLESVRGRRKSQR